MSKRKRITGLGDVVAAVTSFVGIVPCEACLERQNKWNVLHPFNLKSREVTVDEWIEWNKLDSKNKHKLEAKEVVYVCEFYASVFNRPYFQPCSGCSPQPIIEMINQLTKLYETN